MSNSHATIREELARLRNVQLNWRAIREAVDRKLAVRDRPSALQLATIADVVNEQLAAQLKG